MPLEPDGLDFDALTETIRTHESRVPQETHLQEKLP